MSIRNSAPDRSSCDLQSIYEYQERFEPASGGAASNSDSPEQSKGNLSQMCLATWRGVSGSASMSICVATFLVNYAGVNSVVGRLCSTTY